MPYDKDLIKNELNIKDGIDTLRYKRQFRKDNPTYFEADGLIVYTGAQGSGKTLSAVKYACDLMEWYGKSKLVTNLMIKDYPIVSLEEWIRKKYGLNASINLADFSEQTQSEIISEYMALNRVFPFNNQDDLMRYKNYSEGVVYLIDEIQLYFNSLESKNINLDVMTEISQQRKQRKHIIATSQVFGRLAKPLREQFNTVVSCSNLFGILQHNYYLRQEDIKTDDDYMHPHGAVYQSHWFFHKVRDYERYDTYYKILKNNFISGEERNIEIYDRISLSSHADDN